MAETAGQVTLRSENVSKVVTGFALREYKMRQLLVIESSSSDLETYYRETAAELTASGGRDVGNIAPLAQFPYVAETWTRVEGRHRKYGAETVISVEDAKASNVDVLRRHLIRLARAIAQSEDDYIYDQLSSNAGQTTASTAGWDAGSGQDPIKDILVGIRKIAGQNYNVLGGSGFLLVNPTDYQSLMTWLISTKGASIPQFASDKVVSGVVGTFLGLNIMVSQAVNADEAMVVVAKECGTWKEFAPVQVETILDPGIKYTIRVWSMGQIQVTNTNAIHTTTNTVS